jgi:Ran GTPase-activating protein (RanGAP) involved in mRNA processing and transport
MVHIASIEGHCCSRRRYGCHMQSTVRRIRSSLQRTTQMQLSHQQLGDDAMASIAVLLCISPVTVLDLSFNLMCAIGAQPLVDPLAAGCPSLMTLNLAHNVLGDEGCAVVASLVRSHPALASVDLSANGIGCVGAQALARALSAPRHSSRCVSGPTLWRVEVWLWRWRSGCKLAPF